MTAGGKNAVAWTFRVAGGLVCLATLLPIFRTDEWWVRVLDFPRLQVACIGLLILLPALALWKRLARADRWLALLIAAAVVTQGVQIFPYTPIAREQVIELAELAPPQAGAEVRVFAANVLQDNHHTNRLIDLIAKTKPDLILLTEVDPWWAGQLAGLERDFPHTIKEPLTNTYGMVLYSRFELANAEVRYLIEPEIPSIRTDVKLGNGRMIRFYGVHPRPPGRPGPSGAPADSTKRDAELVMVAREVRGVKSPVIVAGDFNDVAWSHTTRLFQRISRLLDPRVGRGFFNTYNANYWGLRFPLDHLFHSEHFALREFDRLDYIGSDHFPIFTVLRLSEEAPQKQEAPPTKPTDPVEATEKVQDSQGAK